MQCFLIKGSIPKRGLIPNTLFATLLLTLPVIVYAEIVIQNNEQSAEVNGSIINEAGSGANAKMNISSITQKQKIIKNKQQAEVKGVIFNSAQNGASSIINIASKTQTSSSGKQIVKVDGNVVNTASGRGVTSEVTIGNK
jgi:hypothetical protein